MENAPVFLPLCAAERKTAGTGQSGRVVRAEGEFERPAGPAVRNGAAQGRESADRLAIYGSDLSADAVARAQQNLAHAGIDDLVTVQQADLLVRGAPGDSSVMVANPPYGERLGAEDELAAFYPRLGDALKKRFAGWD